MNKTLIIFILSLISALSLAAQQTQTIRGTIRDQDSQTSLPGAMIMVLNTEPVLGAIADENGDFKIQNVPVGRVTLKVSILSYEDAFMSNLLLTLGKELVLNIDLQESFQTLETVEIIADEGQSEVLNDLAIISGRSFSVEETKRYAGAIDDPARMVSSFAGVTGDAMGNNDIVVRGNSPKGILWRMDGIEIPNPNHFADEGNTGGPINALNSNMLGNSDFFTGAFSPEYGNALSGVFDMHLRTGNNEKREYSIGASVLGLDATVEGPFSKNYGGSYLANYRYSTLSLLDGLGIVDYSGVPKYQDGSFKVKLPIGEKHIVSLFGLGGISSIDQEEYDQDDATKLIWKGRSGAKLGFVGLSHMYLLSDKTYMRSYVSAAGTESTASYFLPDDHDVIQNDFNQNFVKSDMRFSTSLNHKFNNRQHIKTGVILTHSTFNMFSNYRDRDTDQLETEIDQNGKAQMLQAFFTWKYRVTEDLTMVTGVHYLNFLYNNSFSIEPRLAMNYSLNERSGISAGVGIHSKPENISVYLAQDLNEDGSYTQHNKELDMTRAAHFVLGYDYLLGANTRLKVEAYYQHLYNSAVENDPNSTFALLNSSGWYTTKELVNQGRGRNYGLELTLERYFNNGFYYMGTASLYKSLYTAMDGVERNTSFDGSYVVNALGGKEFRLGKAEKNRTFFVNTKFSLLGGNRFTPVKLQESIDEGYGIYDEANPYSAKGDDIYKWDLALGVRWNKKQRTSEVKLDIQNVLNSQGVVQQWYDSDSEQLIDGTQLGMLPVISYKINF